MAGPYVQRAYFEMIKSMWFNNAEKGKPSLMRAYSQRITEMGMTTKLATSQKGVLACQIGCTVEELPSCNESTDPQGDPECEIRKSFPSNLRHNVETHYASLLKADIAQAWKIFNERGITYAFTEEIYDLGWGGAGVWFNKINQINGGFVSAVFNVPAGIKRPIIIESVIQKCREKQANTSSSSIYNEACFKSTVTTPGDKDIFRGLRDLENYLNLTQQTSAQKGTKTISTNIIIGAINLIFGTDGIMDIRANRAINAEGKDAYIHPLAQLSAIGRGIINSSIRNIAASTGLSLLGPSFNVIPGVQVATQTATSLFSATAFIGLTAGVLLFYIVPLMPFLFFFFAVGTWVKTIFEAMVGVPLWALAHIKIDGEGLPGDAAGSGYFMILEILLRPIMVIFGLIAAMIIFVTQVRILHLIWDLVVDGVGAGSDPIKFVSELKVESLDEAFAIEFDRSPIDHFFYTIFYTIIIYMMASAAFKLIDLVPNNIMRWIGQSVKTFGDSAQNTAQDIAGTMNKAGYIQGEKLFKQE